MFLLAVLSLSMGAVSCKKDVVVDPAKNPGKEIPEEEKVEEKVPAPEGYVGYRHNDWTYIFKEADANTNGAKNARGLLEQNLDEIDGLLPEAALKVMHKQPIWLERNLTDGAAWYHSSREYLIQEGYMVEKWHCVELCNYTHYVSWTRQNQPYMVLHELCHLYHDQALPGGFENKDVKSAYNNAMKAGKYVNTAYRLDKNTLIEHYDDYYKAKVYATTNQMEYFSEICEAYWGENDYFPFNYNDLKEYDPEGFALMEKIWGPRTF